MSEMVGDTPETAILLTESGSVVGDLALNGAVQWYKFDLLGGQSFSLNMVASGATPGDVRLKYYATSTEPDNPRLVAISGQTQLLDAGDAGTYYLCVGDINDADSAGEGAFTLTVDLSDTTGRTALWAGSGTIGSAVLDSLSPDKDTDWYGYDLVAGQSYGFSLSGREGSTPPGVVLVLHEANGNVVLGPVAGGLANFVPAADGRYYVEIVDLAADGVAGGDYQLDSWTLPADEIAPAAPRPIGNGHALSSLIDVAPDTDRFALQAVAGATYHVRLTGSGDQALAAGALTVLDPQGAALTGAVSGATSGAGLVFSFTAESVGKYLLQIGGQGGTGGYTVQVTSTLSRVDGTAGHDVLTGLAEGNLMLGLGGNDRIDGGAGNDTIHGGSGNDTLNGGAGTDVLLLTGSGNATVDLLKTGVQNTGQGMDVISGFENVIGGTGNDSILGDTGANRLLGGAGNDTLMGRDGADTLRGDAGDDLLVGGNGVDIAEYLQSVSHVIDLRRTVAQNTGEGLDRLSGIEGLTTGAGRDSLTGNSAANILSGGAGHDTLLGLTGHDRLDGGLGNDWLDGGIGNDWLNGGSGIDTLVLRSAVNHTIDLRVTGGQRTGEGTDTIRGIENITDLAGRNDRFTGNSAANALLGGGGNDTLLGLAGHDRLDGGVGNDWLDGGVGNDRLIGGLGSDRLIGGDGSDTLAGGGGADRFVFDRADGRDRVLDFQDGQDLFLIQGARAADLALRQSGSDMVVSFGTTVIIVAGVTPAELTLDDFRFF